MLVQKKINLFKLIFIIHMGWWVIEKLSILHINLNIKEKKYVLISIYYNW